MPLTHDDILRAYAGHPIKVPDGLFGPFTDPDINPDSPQLRQAVEWFKGFIGTSEWERRRFNAFVRFQATSLGASTADGRGRFFDDSDTFAWFLFQAESLLDHPWNYEPMYGSRVVPAFDALGRSLDALRTIPGVDERVRRLVGPERRQPNGGVFELLVAAAYCRAGAQVSFRPEQPGEAKSWDLDVQFAGREFAVECKRLETSVYGDNERATARSLWAPASSFVISVEQSIFADVTFLVPLDDIPERYLLGKVAQWSSAPNTQHSWEDRLSLGTIRRLDLGPIRDVLRTDELLVASTRTQQLLTGRYVRHANEVHAIRRRGGMSPRHMSDCDLAVVLRWASKSEAAINAKARDVFKRLADANDQLPKDRPGIVHIGFEAVEGDEVEKARFNKIVESTGRFDPKGKPLEYVYCHYLVPESPPDINWAFDETIQWRRFNNAPPRPVISPFLILPDDAETRLGTHWQ